MTGAQLLEQLRGLQIPASSEAGTQAVISSVPIALATGCLVLIVGAAIYWWRFTAWRRNVNRELREVDNLTRAGEADYAWQRLAVLLRRLSKHVDPDTAASTQTGEYWLHQLDQTFQTDQFTQGSARLIATRPYQQTSRIGAQGQSSKQDLQSPDQQSLTQILQIVRQFLAAAPANKR